MFSGDNGVCSLCLMSFLGKDRKSTKKLFLMFVIRSGFDYNVEEQMYVNVILFLLVLFRVFLS